jgi:hypothetical protein
MLCLPYYAYVLSSTKLEIGQNRFCLEVRGGGGEMVVEGSRGQKLPNVCTFE